MIDETAIRIFIGTRYPQLVTAIALMLGSRPAAEDAVQEALARAWERSLRGVHIENLEAWVTTVALNLGRSGLRRLISERRARARLRGAGRLGGLAPEPSGDRVDVVRALRELPRRQRETTVLRYYLDLDVTEIAAVLRIKEGTAKTTLHRARLGLAERLGERDAKEVDQGER